MDANLVEDVIKQRHVLDRIHAPNEAHHSLIVANATLCPQLATCRLVVAMELGRSAVVQNFAHETVGQRLAGISLQSAAHKKVAGGVLQQLNGGGAIDRVARRVGVDACAVPGDEVRHAIAAASYGCCGAGNAVVGAEQVIPLQLIGQVRQPLAVRFGGLVQHLVPHGVHQAVAEPVHLHIDRVDVRHSRAVGDAAGAVKPAVQPSVITLDHVHVDGAAVCNLSQMPHTLHHGVEHALLVVQTPLEYDRHTFH